MTTENITWLFVALSLLGNYFVIKKNVAGQWIWATSNLGWIYYDITLGAYSQAVLFTVFLGMNVWGIIAWTKSKEELSTES